MTRPLGSRRGAIVTALIVPLSVVALAVGCATPQAAGPPAAPPPASSAPSIRLPDGFQPEGIATGRGTTFYAGSMRDGAIYRGDLLTGQGSVLVPGEPGRSALGLKVDDRNRLFVAGRNTGKATVYDAASGTRLADYQAAPAGSSFLNDVVVTRDAAYFTDSLRPFLYVVPFGPNGDLPAPDAIRSLALTGDLTYRNNGPDYCTLAPQVNVNGIEATPDGKQLIVVQLNTGLLFSVDPASGATRTIALRGGNLTCGDGLLLRDHTLYAVQNLFNKVAVIELDPAYRNGTLTRTITDPTLDTPATIATSGGFLYAVNGRFTTTPATDTKYQIVRLPLS